MTARNIYEAVLIELNKVDAPSLLLEDFVYLANKAINQYINKHYNIYDVNQQTTDDLRVLKSTAMLKPTKVLTFDSLENPYYAGKPLEITNDFNELKAVNSLFGATYEVTLPTDYLHILGCVCIYKAKSKVKCYSDGGYYPFAALRLTSDAWPVVINNFYLKPSYKRPYYFIHNVNTNDELPTNPYQPGTLLGKGTDVALSETTKEVQKLTRAIKSAILGTSNDLINDGGFIKLQNSNKWLIAYITKDGEARAKFTSEKARLSFLLVPYSSLWTTPDYTYPNNFYYKLTAEESNQTNDYILNSKRIDLENETISPILNLSRTLDLSSGVSLDLVERDTGVRYGNASPVRMEIRYGKDDSVFELAMVQVDYIKTPQYICLTPELIDTTIDTSLIMEFPDYVCQEIINELVHIIMENSSDPRLQTHIPVSQSIALPTQQLTA